MYWMVCSLFSSEPYEEVGLGREEKSYKCAFALNVLKKNTLKKNFPSKNGNSLSS